MSFFSIVFWLLIVLVAALAFAIESGLTARHRRVVLSSIFTATITAAYMMFAVEDKSAFDFAPPPKPVAKKGKETYYRRNGGDDGGGKNEIEVVDLAEKRRKDLLTEAERLLAMAGGFKDCEDCPLMVGVREGTYLIGSPDDEIGRRANEGPRKQITITHPIAFARYEVKRIEYAGFVKATGHRSARECTVNGKVTADASWIKPGFEQTDHHPVVCVSWRDAAAYAAWLSKKTDRTYRLPTEGEWEYMARAGTTGPNWQGRAFSNETALFGGVKQGTMPSGQFPDNPFKIFDTSGNVWEMTADCYKDTLAVIPPNASAVIDPKKCDRRTARGGAWDSTEDRVRSAAREGVAQTIGANNTGFRVARVLYPPVGSEPKKPAARRGRPERAEIFPLRSRSLRMGEVGRRSKTSG